jgi:hypothetical protein
MAKTMYVYVCKVFKRCGSRGNHHTCGHTQRTYPYTVQTTPQNDLLPEINDLLKGANLNGAEALRI